MSDISQTMNDFEEILAVLYVSDKRKNNYEMRNSNFGNFFLKCQTLEELRVDYEL